MTRCKTNPKHRPHARILLVRHGRTRWNVERRRQGREDIPLDNVGRSSADALSVLLAAEAIDAIYSSPLSRVRDTAEPTAVAHDLPITIDDDLLELDFGTFSGTSRMDAKVRLRKDYLRTPLPGGESLADAWQRAERFMSRIKPELMTGRTLLIVSHKRLNRLLLGVLQGRSLEETAADNSYRPSPGAMVTLQLARDNDQWRVLAIGGQSDASDTN
jgi:glucosyl-3-phosphoglycerate phosphatase